MQVVQLHDPIVYWYTIYCTYDEFTRIHNIYKKNFIARLKFEIMSAEDFLFWPAAWCSSAPPRGDMVVLKFDLNDIFHFWSIENLLHIMTILSSSNKEVKYVIIRVT